MSYQPLVDAWHESREDRTPLRPSGRRRGRWAALEHAVAGGHRRDDGAGIADTTPGRGRGLVCVDDTEIQDAETPDTDLDFGVLGEDLDQEHGDRRSGGRGELGLEDEINEDINEEIDPEAGDDDEEPAA